VFDLSSSVSHKFITPSSPKKLSVLSEMNEKIATIKLHLRLSVVRDVFNLSASDNLVTPSLPILFSEFSENELKQQDTTKIE
jgi:hypothetical protein